MKKKIIPVVCHSLLPDVTSKQPASPLSLLVHDKLSRPLRDLRISVTDRCNMRCIYCMPKQHFGNHFRFIPHHDMLSFEEISRIASIFVKMGVEKIRLTGGEPLVRRHIEKLIEQLACLKTPDGYPIDLTLTTNGSLLSRKARQLYDAGLKRITVSLDALDDTVFRRMNDVDLPVADVLKGIETAQHTGFSLVKVNMVVKRGVNDKEILPIARYFRHTSIIPRFIEYMDVGSSNGWQLNEMMPTDELVNMIQAEMPLEKLASRYPGETASRWRYQDGSGEIGTIASVTHPFCSTCTRIRLSTTGKLYPCLFASNGMDLKSLIRSGQSDEQILQTLVSYWQNRESRYSELRYTNVPESGKKIEMFYIGG